MVVKNLGEEGHKNKPVQSVEQFQLRTPLDKSKSVAIDLVWINNHVNIKRFFYFILRKEQRNS